MMTNQVEEDEFAERLSSVRRQALVVLGSADEADRWIRSPAMGLDQRKPIDLLRTPEGFEQVETLLGRMDYGVYT